MWPGTRRLLLLTIPSPRKALRDRLTKQTKVALSYAPHAGPAELLDDCITAAVDLVLRQHGGPVWDHAAFERLREAVRADAGDRAVLLFNQTDKPASRRSVETPPAEWDSFSTAISPSVRGLRRTEMDRSELAPFEAVAGATLGLVGYELSSSRR